MLTDDRNWLSRCDVVARVPIIVPRDTVEIFLDKRLSSRESVASAHGEIMTDRMSESTVTLEGGETLTFDTKDEITISIERVAVLPAKLTLLSPSTAYFTSQHCSARLASAAEIRSSPQCFQFCDL